VRCRTVVSVRTCWKSSASETSGAAQIGGTTVIVAQGRKGAFALWRIPSLFPRDIILEATFVTKRPDHW